MEINTSLIKKYESNPILHSLIQLVPMGIGSAIDSGLITHINNIRSDRLRVFFDRLASGELNLTEEMIREEDFLHAFFMSTHAALNTRRREKIELLGRLFSNYVNNEHFKDIDDYEEVLSILDDLEYREIMILLILHKFEEQNPIKEEQNALQRSSVFWKNFLTKLENDVGIDFNDINGYLSRLNRSGLYQTFTGGFWDYSGDQGCLTPLFYKLIERIKNK